MTWSTVESFFCHLPISYILDTQFAWLDVNEAIFRHDVNGHTGVPMRFDCGNCRQSKVCEANTKWTLQKHNTTLTWEVPKMLLLRYCYCFFGGCCVLVVVMGSRTTSHVKLHFPTLIQQRGYYYCYLLGPINEYNQLSFCCSLEFSSLNLCVILPSEVG